MNKPRILFWHRKDLRIFDNQALIKAFSLSNAITSTYILDKNYSHDFNANSRAWFLGNSLQELGNNWKKMGSRLIIDCLLYTSPSPRDAQLSRMPSSA